MASSNRHWPSLFKSKPCGSHHHHHHHQWQHDVTNHSSLLPGAGCQKPSYTSSGAEERSPEPKPRWNPKPEQIRILEAIFNSGMVNPPRDEIRKIRTQLQEYGQVGDANVFYWFQNRKSRSKHKHRHLQSRSHARANSAKTPVVGPALSSASSTSSGSAGSDKILPLVSAGTIEALSVSDSPTLPANETAFRDQAPLTDLLVEPFSYLQGGQGFCFSAVPGYPEQFGISAGPASWCELLWGQEACKINGGAAEQVKIDKLQNPNSSPAAGLVYDPAATTAAGVGVPVPFSEIQVAAAAGAEVGGAGGAARSTVFINEVAFDVAAGPLNVREAFGDEAILIHSSGHPVLTDQWGLTLQPLEHGASYYTV